MVLNGDGHADILSGSYSRMEESMAGLFQILWGNSEGKFTPAATLNGTDEKPLMISVPESSAGYDSDVDRICTRPVAVDWDGDGDVDLLSGSTNGGVHWAENTAGAGKLPELKAFVALIEPGPQTGQGEMLKESELTGPTRSTRTWVDDVNEDGKLDVLVGDSTTLTSPAEGLTEEECKAKEVDWQSKMEGLSKKLNAVEENTDSAKSKKVLADYNTLFNTLYQERNTFIKEDRTGFVWLYLQK